MNKQSGFTIVELLVVIVIIGVLAAITISSYIGVSNKATSASLQSDLANASKLLKLFISEQGSYPITVSTDCITNPDSATNKCLKLSNNSTLLYTAFPQSYYLFESNGTTCYDIADDLPPTVNTSCIPKYISIGSQVWMGNNMNVGSMILGSIAQTNNSTLEKYCYANDETNCTKYGAFYRWGEAVQYLNSADDTHSPSPAFSGNIRGICPVNFHIPTDSEFKTLELYLNMTQGQADAIGYRGTTQGTQLKIGGSSWFSGQLTGAWVSGSFSLIDSFGYYWSSTESSATNSWYRALGGGYNTVYRNNNYAKSNGFSIRCLRD